MGRAASCSSKSTYIATCGSAPGPVGCKQVFSSAGLDRRTWRKWIHWSWRSASLLRLSCPGISCPSSSQVGVEATTRSLASTAPGISLWGRTLMDSKGAGPACRIVLGKAESEYIGRFFHLVFRDVTQFTFPIVQELQSSYQCLRANAINEDLHHVNKGISGLRK